MATVDVIALEDHVISCVISDVPVQITGVTWAPATEIEGEYRLTDGSMKSNSQTSTLTITESKLVALDEQSSGIHTFICSFTIGTTDVPVWASQTITIFQPSNFSISKSSLVNFVIDPANRSCITSRWLNRFTTCFKQVVVLLKFANKYTVVPL